MKVRRLVMFYVCHSLRYRICPTRRLTHSPVIFTSCRYFSKRGNEIDPDDDLDELTANFRKAINDPRFETAQDAALVWHSGANASNYYDDDVELLPLENVTSREPLRESNELKRKFKITRLSSLALAEAYAKADAHHSKHGAAKPKIALRRKIEEPKMERIRVLDIDRLPLNDLHHLFAYSMVRRLPAEDCVKIVSRIAKFRDVQSQKSYEALLRNCTRTFGAYAPELLALFTRCHQTVSAAYLLDYTRRFGTFSKRFIVEQLQKSAAVSLFDFVRYENVGGRRKLPAVLSKPFALSSYVQLMGDSTTKQSLLHMLDNTGAVPASHAVPEEQLEAAARMEERLASNRIENKKRHATTSEFDERSRPALMDHILAAEYSQVSLDEYFSLNPELEDPRNSGLQKKIPTVVDEHLNNLEQNFASVDDDDDDEESNGIFRPADFQDDNHNMEEDDQVNTTAGRSHKKKINNKRVEEEEKEDEWLMEGGQDLSWLEDLDDEEIFRDGGDVSANGLVRGGRRPMNVREGFWMSAGSEDAEATLAAGENLMASNSKADNANEVRHLQKLRTLLTSPHIHDEVRAEIEDEDEDFIDQDELKFQEVLRKRSPSANNKLNEKDKNVFDYTSNTVRITSSADGLDDLPFRRAMARIRDIERQVDLLKKTQDDSPPLQHDNEVRSRLISAVEFEEDKAYSARQAEWVREGGGSHEDVASRLERGDSAHAHMSHVSADVLRRGFASESVTQQIKVHKPLTLTSASSDLVVTSNSGTNNMQEDRLDENASRQERWWSDGREDKFFRHNKKAYRFDEKTGWSEVEDRRPSGGRAKRRTAIREVRLERGKMSREVNARVFEEIGKRK